MNASAARLAAARPRIAPKPAIPARGTPGWAIERQRVFLGSIAGGCTVEGACAAAGMPVSAAYAFRQARAGHAFALAWEAANLLARQPLHDLLMEHVLKDDVETVVRIDAQTVTRRRFNYRLAFRMLDRIEKRASALAPDAFDDARLVAGEFDLFLDMLAEGSGPEASAAFLGPRRAAAADRKAADVPGGDTPRETRPTPPDVILRPGEAERGAPAEETRPTPPNVILRPGEKESGAPEEVEDTRPTPPGAPLYLAADSGLTADEAATEEPFPPRVANRAARRAAAARLRHR